MFCVSLCVSPFFCANLCFPGFFFFFFFTVSCAPSLSYFLCPQCLISLDFSFFYVSLAYAPSFLLSASFVISATYLINTLFFFIHITVRKCTQVVG